MVSELINPVTSSWDVDVIETHLYAMDKEAILNIPLSSRVHDDFWAWHYDRRGIFTVKSAYRMISGIKHQREDWLEHKPSHSNTEADSKS